MIDTTRLSDHEVNELLVQDQKAHHQNLINTLAYLTEMEIIRLLSVDGSIPDEHKRLYRALRDFRLSKAWEV